MYAIHLLIIQNVTSERPQVPRSAVDFFNLPEKYTKGSDGGLFLRTVKYVDTAETKVMLLFISDHGINVLKTCTSLQADGTFSTCPENFAQLYFVFAAYALLPNESQETYKVLSLAIKEEVGDMSHVGNLIVDFESAVRSAFKKVFPGSKINGCIFHMRQAIQRQLGQKGVSSLYNTSPTFHKINQFKTLSVCLFFHWGKCQRPAWGTCYWGNWCWGTCCWGKC